MTPPKAGPPKPGILKLPPGGGEDKKGKEKEKIEPGPAKRPVDPKGVKATPKSPPPQGLSSYSSESVGNRSPGEKRSRTRSPFVRRPHGAKQRRKFAQGKFGRVQFADPIDDSQEKRAEESDRERREKQPVKGGAKSKEKGRGKGKGKNKGKGKGKQNKGKDKGQKDQRGEKPGKGSSSRSGGRN